MVPERIEELCDYIKDKWELRAPCTYHPMCFGKLNWIHPFTDGNGRTSRAASYLVLCIKLGYLLPGRMTIPEQISQDKRSYYQALESADLAWERGVVDLSAMKELLSSMLAKQLVAVHEDSRAGQE
jgi:Fic family protein